MKLETQNKINFRNFSIDKYLKFILYYIIGILNLIFINLHAQNVSASFFGSISGQIIDSVNSNGIEYATITLFDQVSGKITNGTTSNEKGYFELTNVPNGKYYYSIYFIGYKTPDRQSIEINQNKQQIVLGQIKLSPMQALLKEVEVTTERDLIENKIDKTVYNVDRDMTAIGGVASDALKKIPDVSIDVNGNVELQGNSNVRFLINGKPSSMFGNNVADVLKSIPTSQIQSIEVVTSPGAKYDAEGGGIINIILKKNTAKGFNGNVSVTSGTRLENGALNLNFRNGKFGLNTFFSGNAQLLTTTHSNLNRNSEIENLKQNSYLAQQGLSDFNRNGYQSGLSFQWDLDKFNSISTSINYNYMHNNSVGNSTRQIRTIDSSGYLIDNENNLINSLNRVNLSAVDLNLNYKKTFKKEGQELELLVTNSSATNSSYYSQSLKLLNSTDLLSGTDGANPGRDHQTNIALNYKQPVSKDLLFETGIKSVFSSITGESKVYLFNNINKEFIYNFSQSNQFEYRRSVYAYYLSATYKLFNFLDVISGCRIENTQTNANYSNYGTVSIQPYNSVVPSITIAHSFKKRETVKLAYSRRISRPGYRDVNPFINAVDPKNINSGNPNLKPEYSDNFELGFNKPFGKGNNLNINAHFDANYQDIQPYSRYYTSYKIGDSIYKNIAISIRENIGKEYNSVLRTSASFAINSKFNLRTNIMGMYRVIKSVYSDGSITGFMYRMNLTATYVFSNSLSAEVFGNFNSPRINVQGIQPTFTTYNIAIRKLFWNKNASIAITATNPFDKYVNQKTQLKGINFSSTNLLLLPYRSFGLNFTYKFGKIEFKKQKEIEDANLTNPVAPASQQN